LKSLWLRKEKDNSNLRNKTHIVVQLAEGNGKMLDFTTYTPTWSSLCSSPAGCERPGCLHMCGRLPPSDPSCVFL